MWKYFKIPVFGIVTLGIPMTQVKFSDAKSNFSSWIPDFLPTPIWLNNPNSDSILLVIFIMLSLLCFVWVFWDNINLRKDKTKTDQLLKEFIDDEKKARALGKFKRTTEGRG